MNLFELASIRKYRFPTTKGNATTEDLWTLSLESLNKIALTLDELLSTKNYINKEVKDKEDNENKLEIIKHIITVKISKKDISNISTRGESPKFL